MDLLKRLCPYFFQDFCPGDCFFVNPFLRFTKTADCFTKILGLKGRFFYDFWLLNLIFRDWPRSGEFWSRGAPEIPREEITAPKRWGTKTSTKKNYEQQQDKLEEDENIKVTKIRRTECHRGKGGETKRTKPTPQTQGRGKFVSKERSCCQNNQPAKTTTPSPW